MSIGRSQASHMRCRKWMLSRTGWMNSSHHHGCHAGLRPLYRLCVARDRDVARVACDGNKGYKYADKYSSIQRLYSQYLLSLLSASLCLLPPPRLWPRIHIALASRGFRYAGPGIPSLLIWDISTLTLPSNIISKLTYSSMQGFLGILAPESSFRALLIWLNSCWFLGWNYTTL